MIQYFHAKNLDLYLRYTVAIDLPEKSDLLKLIPFESSKVIAMQCGYSIVHPKDQYDRRVGREVSSQRLGLRFFTLETVEYLSDHILLNLQRYSDINDIDYIKIRISEKSDKPHLLEASLHHSLNNL